MTPELAAWLEYEKILKVQIDLEKVDKYFIFADLERQYQERLLLQEINQIDEAEKQHRAAQPRCANYGDGS